MTIPILCPIVACYQLFGGRRIFEKSENQFSLYWRGLFLMKKRVVIEKEILEDESQSVGRKVGTAITLLAIYLLVTGGFMALIYYTKPWAWSIWQAIGMR